MPGFTLGGRPRHFSRVQFIAPVSNPPQNLSLTTTDAPTTAEAVTASKQLFRTATDGPTTAEAVDWVGALNRFGFNPPR